MNSPAHYLKKSILNDSYSSNYPSSVVNINNGKHIKRPSFNVRS